MIIFWIIMAIAGWATAFFLLKQRNKTHKECWELNKRIRDKAVEEIGFNFYVDNNKGYMETPNNILDKVTFVLKKGVVK